LLNHTKKSGFPKETASCVVWCEYYTEDAFKILQSRLSRIEIFQAISALTIVKLYFSLH